MSILGNLLSCIKGVKLPFEFLEGLEIALEVLQWNWASSRDEGGIL